MDRRIVFVVNPRSANGDTGRIWRSLSSRFREKLGDFGELFTSRPMEAAELTRRSLEAGADVIVAVGGDGTVNEVVNGFFDAKGAVVRPGAALAVLPRGTGGDFRRTFGWPTTADAALSRLSAGTTRPLDVGKVTYTSHAGRPESRYFVNIGSFGVSGLVDRYANESSKALGGKASFALASLRAMLDYQDRRCRVRFDDGPVEELTVTTLAVANGQYFGGGMWAAPKAAIDDGLFDVTLWSGFGLTDFVVRSRRIYDGTHVTMKGTRTLRVRKVHAECDAECLLDLDGEAPGRLPATFEIVPGALRLVTR